MSDDELEDNELEGLEAIFSLYEDEYIQFDRIENPKHSRPDLYAFLMLAELFPSQYDMVAAAEHDVIYLDVDCDTLLVKVGEIGNEFIRDLVRCGVMYDEDSLRMFV